MTKNIEAKLNALIVEDKPADVDASLLEAVKAKMTEEDKPADTEETAEKPEADSVEDAPAVSIDNPLNPEVMSKEEEDEAEEEGQSPEEKKSVKESVAELLGDEFSDEFKLKATAIFEAAVKNHVMSIRAELDEEFASKRVELEEEIKSRTTELESMFETRVQEYESTLNDKIDGHLSYIAEEWVKQNEVAIDSSIRAELTESFIMGIKSVFEQHYVDLPEEKLDLVNQLSEQNKTLEQSLSRAIMEMAEINKRNVSMTRDHIINESAKDLTAIDYTKFKALVEDFEFESEDSFKKRAAIVRETFFKTGTQATTRIAMVEEFVKSKEVAQQVVESKVLEITEAPVQDKAMGAYLKALGSKS